MLRIIYDIVKLKDFLYKWNFSVVFKNYLEVLDSEDLRVDDVWIEYRDIYFSTVVEIFG